MAEKTAVIEFETGGHTGVWQRAGVQQMWIQMTPPPALPWLIASSPACSCGSGLPLVMEQAEEGWKSLPFSQLPWLSEKQVVFPSSPIQRVLSLQKADE